MKTKITDNWEVELINDIGDKLTLKGKWYADFFREYDNKQLIIADVVVPKATLCDGNKEGCTSLNIDTSQWKVNGKPL